MRVYADSSFIVRLLFASTENLSAKATFHRLGRPSMFYLPLHELEVCNGILQRAFHDEQSGGRAARAEAARVKATSLARVEKMVARKGLLRIAPNWERATKIAVELTFKHTEAIGARSLDILHVAFALMAEAELFITCDRRQAALAKREGLKLNYVE